MKTAYSERNYAFGQTMLTLRTEIGLTQKGLADLLGVSRRAVGEWEAGSSYPKAEHLKAMIALGVQQHAWPSGHETEAIRALWKLARQKVLLDEHWLSSQLSTQSHQTAEQDKSPDTERHMERIFTLLQGKGVRNDREREVQLLDRSAQEALADSIEEFLAWCPPAFPVGMHLLRGLQEYLNTADPQAAAAYWEEVLQAQASTRTHIRRIAHALYQQTSPREREAVL
jgi:transcriptional regulator with XRE-family HTH domain